MKLSKETLKEIVKGCMKELIAEGAFNAVIKECLGKPRVSQNIKKPSAAVFEEEETTITEEHIIPVNKNKSGLPKNNSAINSNLKALVETAAASITSDQNKTDLYAQIFADTAVNTLPQMMAKDNLKEGYGALMAAGLKAQETEVVAPEQLDALAQFGGHGDIMHWSKIAFSNKKQ